jgi:anti-sigma-K factor RskA
MSEPEDIEGLAGEYVLGTLDPAERARVASQRERDPELDAAITLWERRLSPLDETTAAVEPPADMLARIEAAIGIAGSRQDRLADAEMGTLARRLGFWRGATFATGGLAALLAIALVWSSAPQREQSATFVAVLQRDPASPAFVIEVNFASKLLTVRRVSAEKKPGKSYELWMIHDKLGAPKSLGVVADQGFTIRSAPVNYDPALVESATYAVTLEPLGGSPTGAPSGAPLWTGKLVQTTP